MFTSSRSFDGLANALSIKTSDLATRRVRAERMPEWQPAFNRSGPWSSYTRASIIGERVYERAAPIPDVTPSPDRNTFLHEVAAVVERAARPLPDHGVGSEFPNTFAGRTHTLKMSSAMSSRRTLTLRQFGMCRSRER